MALTQSQAAAQEGSAPATATAGGGAAAPPRERPTPPAGASGGDLDAKLASILSPEDATRWKTILQADDEAAQRTAASAGRAQLEDGSDERMDFSEAYLAAMPPRAASGLLQGLLGGQE